MKLPILHVVLFGVCLVGLVSGQVQKPKAYGILIDNTGSMRPQIDVETDLAKEIVKQLPDNSAISIFAFATESDSKMARVVAALDCSTDRTAILKLLDRNAIVGGRSTVIDAIKHSAERLTTAKPVTCGPYSETNLLVISDGQDRASVTEPKDLIAKLKENGTKVYVIGLIDGLESTGGLFGKSPKKRSTEFFEELTTETGGRVVFPKKNQKVAEVVKLLLAADAKQAK